MRALLLVGFLVGACAHAEPDAAQLGQARGYPLGGATTWAQVPYRVGSFSALDQVPGIVVRRVDASTAPQPLPRMADAPAIRYRFRNLDYTLDDYLERQRATGLLILKDGQVVAERYRYGRQPDARFLSFSMAKSVTSLLVGVAQAQGAIASLDDPAQKYAKELQGTPYGETPIRHLLRMSSGLTFTERYDGNDDIARMTLAFATEPQGTLPVLRGVQERHDPAGAVFRYASAETDVLGRVLVGATGRSIAALTHDWLWEPMGAERDAFWRVGRDGQEGAHGFFNATLRDWARLGLLLARDGRVGERQVVPREYLLEATDVAKQPSAFRPGATRNVGYGYQFWLLNYRERTFAMQGIYGQGLFVQPASGIVMVLTSAWQQPSAQQDPLPSQERAALWRGVLRSLGGAID
ncbi:beta-lactamase family protein [Ramlibacter sp. XY19]|uniref:serine hydrolase domain-containing protein n=1 Tax=Ramlibacter paludis TaxID=2908000 RepID=UPI0023DC8102|nr:serine hydrolase [Ramlibacter paludis]MCG2594522.1 beta-lactamase family protein [Ramlibacter paludis]